MSSSYPGRFEANVRVIRHRPFTDNAIAWEWPRDLRESDCTRRTLSRYWLLWIGRNPKEEASKNICSPAMSADRVFREKIIALAEESAKAGARRISDAVVSNAFCEGAHGARACGVRQYATSSVGQR